jgi:hypothetical protein
MASKTKSKKAQLGLLPREERCIDRYFQNKCLLENKKIIKEIELLLYKYSANLDLQSVAKAESGMKRLKKITERFV